MRKSNIDRLINVNTHDQLHAVHVEHWNVRAADEPVGERINGANEIEIQSTASVSRGTENNVQHVLLLNVPVVQTFFAIFVKIQSFAAAGISRHVVCSISQSSTCANFEMRVEGIILDSCPLTSI